MFPRDRQRAVLLVPYCNDVGSRSLYIYIGSRYPNDRHANNDRPWRFIDWTVYQDRVHKRKPSTRHRGIWIPKMKTEARHMYRSEGSLTACAARGMHLRCIRGSEYVPQGILCERGLIYSLMKIYLYIYIVYLYLLVSRRCGLSASEILPYNLRDSITGIWNDCLFFQLSPDTRVSE